MPYYFYDGTFQDYLPPPSVDVHEVPVFFEDYELPGLVARIGAYKEGGPYSLNLDWGFNLPEAATLILQEKNRLKVGEWVGGIVCSSDRCVLTKRYH